jgi:CheY-like chemotaxis protein
MKKITELTPETNQIGWFKRLCRRLFKTQSPDQSAALNPASNRDAHDSNPELFRRKGTVLVVDDDPVFVKAVEVLLKGECYKVLTATNGADAMTLVREKQPQVIVVDVNLPQDVAGVPWDGYRITTWLQRFEEWKNIPVVVVSGSDPRTCTRAALKSGATAFYHKQMASEHLLTLVKQALLRKNPAPMENKQSKSKSKSSASPNFKAAEKRALSKTHSR